MKPKGQRRRFGGEIEGTISTAIETELILPKTGREIAMWVKEFYFWMICHAPCA
jgi:hypothetical protein